MGSGEGRRMKMTEKFAIEYLIRNGFKLEEEYNNFARQVVGIAVEALEKQIPKLVDTIPGDYEPDYNCTVCGETTGYEHQKYCIECGQRLEW